jgi:diguanylate cyclase (GGDEF)-like protein
MPTWPRVALTVAAWCVAAALHAPLGERTGSAPALASLLALGATAWLWGGLVGLVVGAAIGALRAGLLADLGSLESLVLRLGAGAFLDPLTFGALGFALGSVGRLRGQMRVHRDASDRASYDALTGLLTRTTFEVRLAAWMRAAPGAAGATFAVLFVDLDRFKVVNDTYGHGVGDQLLRHIARTLLDTVRGEDLVARVGGDEFVIALRALRDHDTAAAIASKLVARLAVPVDIDGRGISVSASIGIAVYPRDGADVAALTKSADYAMYRAKSAGKNAFNFSTQEMRADQSRRLELERALRFALHDNELALAYQPQVELATGRFVGFEALLRWRSRQLGVVSPSEFVPIAEEAGLIVTIGHWLHREVCFQLRAWSAFGGPDLKVAVNVSALQFRQPEFLEQLARAIADARIEPRMLEIEITESVLIDQLDLAAATLRRLERIGVSSALDDFGTGYSSLLYLQRLPIGTLKIDRSFVAGLALSATGRTGTVVPIIEAVTALGRTLGKSIVAEGVETEAQARYLRKLGVDRAQGYLFGMPLSPTRAEALLRAIAARDAAGALPVPPSAPGRVLLRG